MVFHDNQNFLSQSVSSLLSSSPSVSSLFKPMPPISTNCTSTGSNPEVWSKLKIQQALDQFLAEFRSPLRPMAPADTRANQELMIQALILEKEARETRLSHAKQEQLLHDILFSSQQQQQHKMKRLEQARIKQFEKVRTSQFEPMPVQQQTNWWHFPPPNLNSHTGNKVSGAGKSSSLSKQLVEDSHFSQMPIVPKASRIFRTQVTPVTSHAANLFTGTQSLVYRSAGPRKSKLDEESNSGDVSALTKSKKAETDRKPLYKRSPEEKGKPLYQRLPESEFAPLLPETRGPVTRSRSVGYRSPTKNEQDLVMKIVTSSIDEIQKTIDRYASSNSVDLFVK